VCEESQDFYGEPHFLLQVIVMADAFSVPELSAPFPVVMQHVSEREGNANV
jgi:hypothetical protein